MKIQSRPFTVTVKRPRRSKDKSIWSDTPNLTAMLAEAAEPPAGNPASPSQPVASRSEPKGRSAGSAGSTPSKGPSPRILADLTPVEIPPVVEEPPVRRRGRPRKVVDAATDVGQARPDNIPSRKTPVAKAVIGMSSVDESSSVRASAAGEPVVKASTARSGVMPAERPTGSGASRSRAVPKTIAAWLAEHDEAETVVADASTTGERDSGSILGGGDVVVDAASSEQLAGRRRRGLSKAVPGQRWKRHLPRWKR